MEVGLCAHLARTTGVDRDQNQTTIGRIAKSGACLYIYTYIYIENQAFSTYILNSQLNTLSISNSQCSSYPSARQAMLKSDLVNH